MLQFAANLSFLFSEKPFMERFESAARQGFRGVEYLFPYEWSADQLADCLQTHGLEQVLFNLPPGDWSAGERGFACHPGREGEFSEALCKALEYADKLACKRVHAMAGLALEGVSEGRMRDTFLRNLSDAIPLCERAGVTLLIEPINSQIDMPGYWLNGMEKGLQIVKEIGHPALRFQLDIYHAQVMGESVNSLLERAMPYLGHVQVADYPGRNEPGTGRGALAALSWLAESSYTGWVGGEYRPLGDTVEGLKWLFSDASSPRK